MFRLLNGILEAAEVSVKVSLTFFLYIGVFIMGYQIGKITMMVISNVFIAFIVSVILSSFAGALVGKIVEWVVETYREMFVYQYDYVTA